MNEERIHEVTPHSFETIPAKWTLLSPTFDVAGDSRVEIIFRGGRWLEGPAYSPQGRYLLFSDIPNDRVLRFDEISGRTDVFATPAGYSNGRTIDSEGRFITCHQGFRSVNRTEHDGSVRVLAERIDGGRLNSPNDVVAASDGSIWFTDPTYGIDSVYEGIFAPQEIPIRGLYRWREGSEEPIAVVEDFVQPNGLAFSPDERRLYVVDSEVGVIKDFAHSSGELQESRILVENDAGLDGIKVDERGRIWAATRSGVMCYTADGTALGGLELPERASNLWFGGLQRNILYVTATTSLYAIRLNVSGTPQGRIA